MARTSSLGRNPKQSREAVTTQPSTTSGQENKSSTSESTEVSSKTTLGAWTKGNPLLRPASTPQSESPKGVPALPSLGLKAKQDSTPSTVLPTASAAQQPRARSTSASRASTAQKGPTTTDLPVDNGQDLTKPVALPRKRPASALTTEAPTSSSSGTSSSSSDSSSSTSTKSTATTRTYTSGWMSFASFRLATPTALFPRSYASLQRRVSGGPNGGRRDEHPVYILRNPEDKELRRGELTWIHLGIQVVFHPHTTVVLFHLDLPQSITVMERRFIMGPSAPYLRVQIQYLGRNNTYHLARGDTVCGLMVQPLLLTRFTHAKRVEVSEQGEFHFTHELFGDESEDETYKDDPTTVELDGRQVARRDLTLGERALLRHRRRKNAAAVAVSEAARALTVEDKLTMIESWADECELHIQRRAPSVAPSPAASHPIVTHNGDGSSRRIQERTRPAPLPAAERKRPRPHSREGNRARLSAAPATQAKDQERTRAGEQRKERRDARPTPTEIFGLD